MAESDVVTVRGLRKAYGTRAVVDGLDLDVRAGEIVGLAGANGAGKTTTVECVQGLRRPDAGQLRVLGYDPVTQAVRLRPLIGSQLQDSGLPDRLRVAEAVGLFAARRACDGGELLERFGLAGRRRSAFSSLSRGERQRLFLVLALLNRPRLVILDELTQGLDPAARRSVWAAVRQLRGGGTTGLLVTHEMHEAEALCDRIVVMRAGQVIDSGTPAELVARHARRATVSFSWPDPPASLLAEIGRLDGVRDLRRTGAGHRGRRPAHHRLRRRRPAAARIGTRRPGRARARPRRCHAQPARARDGRRRGRPGTWRTGGRTAMSTMGRLIRAELRLMARDPLVLTFVVAFPIVTMLIIGGAFGTAPDPAFDGTNPSHWYVASYLTVVIAAVGLVMLPVHLASYRERGVLRRFAAAGFPRWSFAVAQLVVGLLTTVVACALLLAVAAPVYGIPAVHDGWRVAAALPLGAVAFVSIGVLLGSLLPSARSAQAVGLLLFFPSFLLGAGGPPPKVMGSAVKMVAGPLPLTQLTDAVREPWLGLAPATGSLAVLAGMAVAVTVIAARRAAL